MLLRPRRSFTASLAPLALGLALTGCLVEQGGPHAPHPEDVAHDVELTVDTTELEEQFVPEDDRLVSPPVELAEGAEQVGVMVTLKGSEAPLELWVRGRDTDVVGPWHEVEWTFHEGDRLAGRSTLDSVYLAVEVAVNDDDARHVAALTFAPAVLEDPSTVDEVGLEEVAEEQNALHPALAFVGVLPRSAWGARNHRCSVQESGGHYHRVALHHGGSKASSNVEAYLRQAQAYHMDGRNYCDIAYHFAVSIDGRVFELRPQPYRGGHTKNNNSGNIGVLHAGCFHPTCGNDPVTAQLKERSAGLLAMFNIIHNIPINSDKVRGHRDHSYASTACPGNALYAALGDIRARANAILADHNNPQPEPEPEPAPDPVVGPAPGCGALTAGAALAPHQSVVSCDGRFALVHQGDGNVVLYMGNTALWSTGTHGQSTTSLAMQGDGNLVLYGPGGAVRWTTGTHGNAGASLAVQNDGNVVLYSAGGAALWHTHTYGH